MLLRIASREVGMQYSEITLEEVIAARASVSQARYSQAINTRTTPINAELTAEVTVLIVNDTVRTRATACVDAILFKGILVERARTRREREALKKCEFHH